MPNFADAISPIQNLGGAQSFLVGYQIEGASIPTNIPWGTPVMINSTDGGLINWNGTTTTAGIAGILAENSFNNLGSTGLGAPQGFSPILSYGSVVGNYPANSTQLGAVISPPMVPMSDGRMRYFMARVGTTFIGKLGTSIAASPSTPVATAYNQVGVSYGLTKDTGNPFWYVDVNKTGGAAVLQISAISPLEPIGTVGGHVLFTFLQGAVQVSG